MNNDESLKIFLVFLLGAAVAIAIAIKKHFPSVDFIEVVYAVLKAGGLLFIVGYVCNAMQNVPTFSVLMFSAAMVFASFVDVMKQAAITITYETPTFGYGVTYENIEEAWWHTNWWYVGIPLALVIASIVWWLREPRYRYS